MSKLPFAELGLSPDLLKAVAKMGYEEASPIQSAAIPILLQGVDVIGQSQTGSGKTAAFALPIIEKVDPAIRAPQALILCPTRELAVQVAEEVAKLAQFKKGIRELPIYGGAAYDRQLRGLQSGAQIIIGTPGRVIDHLDRKSLNLGQVHTLVLDEADRMLDMGFREEIERILEATPTERQTVFFSATLPPQIQGMIKRFARDPKYIQISSQTVDAPNIDQSYYEVGRGSKLETLCRIIDIQNIRYGIIFCSTKMMVDELTEHLGARGYQADKLHGDMAQTMRERVMRRFREKRIEFLVATDVAARGLDVESVEVVFNFDLPNDPEDYVHRIGRTGRAGKAGRAITFVYGREVYKIQHITRFTKSRIRRETVPTLQEVEQKRASALFNAVRETLEKGEFTRQDAFVDELLEQGHTTTDIASALLYMLGGDGRPGNPIAEDSPKPERPSRGDTGGGREYPAYTPREAPPRRDDRPPRGEKPARREPAFDAPTRSKKGAVSRDIAPRSESHEPGMVRLAMNVGEEHGIAPGDVVGVIAGAARVPKESIGAIKVMLKKTFVDVAEDDAPTVLKKLHGIRFKAHKLAIMKAADLS
jgi:ATP-dependent RNA helicase DeaD